MGNYPGCSRKEKVFEGGYFLHEDKTIWAQGHMEILLKKDGTFRFAQIGLLRNSMNQVNFRTEGTYSRHMDKLICEYNKCYGRSPNFERGLGKKTFCGNLERHGQVLIICGFRLDIHPEPAQSKPIEASFPSCYGVSKNWTYGSLTTKIMFEADATFKFSEEGGSVEDGDISFNLQGTYSTNGSRITCICSTLSGHSILFATAIFFGRGPDGFWCTLSEGGKLLEIEFGNMNGSGMNGTDNIILPVCTNKNTEHHLPV